MQIKKNYSLSLSEGVYKTSEEQAKKFGFEKVSHFVEFAMDALNRQDSQTFRFLNQYNTGSFQIKPGAFIHLLLLDKLAKDMIEMQHKIPDNIFYVSGNSQLLQGEEFFKVRYARYKKAYQQAATFKKQIDDCAAEVATEKTIAEVEKNLAENEIELI